MSSAQTLAVLHYIRRFADSCAARSMTDGQLLENFKLRQDEAAFAELLGRHGPMILGVCRRLLHHPQDAEDAFQATFLVLLRRAGAIAKRDSLGSWLYGAAFRIALRAKARANRFRSCDAPDELPDRREGPPDVLARRELCAALHEEINRLPEKYRGPLVLCYLEGTPREEAARRLGWSLGTLRRRLQHGRELLRYRLEHRGVTLSAGLAAAGITASIAPAAVPTALAAATLKAAVLIAAGETVVVGTISAQAAALSKVLLHAIWLTKIKTVTTVFIAVALLGAGVGRLIYYAQAEGQAPVQKPQALADKPGAEMKPLKANKKDSPPLARMEPGAEDDKPKTVSVSILGSDGKPLAGADVAAIGRTLSKQRIWQTGAASEVLGKGKTDGDGKFMFTLPGGASERFWNVFVVARGDKHGLGHKDIDRAPAPSAVELRLPREQVRRGRLVTLQGLPANGVSIRVAQVHGQSQEAGRFGAVRDTFLTEDMPVWPRPMVSDAQGRFILRGIGPDEVPSIAVADARFAGQEFEVKPKSSDQAEEVALALAPGRVVEGRVTYSDTGKPASAARVLIQARQNYNYGSVTEPVECRTDADGRFRAIAQVGNYVDVAAYPPAGEPYLLVHKNMEWPKTGQVKQDVQLALFRGVMVGGKVVERPSGKPVAGASIQFRWRRSQNPYYRDEIGPAAFLGGREDYPVSDADGYFRMVVPPGPGHLLVKGDTPDYLHAEITEHELSSPDVQPNGRHYPDGLVALDLKPGDGAHDVTIALRRGVTRTGDLIGPDGKPVQDAVMLCRSYLPYGFDLNGMSGMKIRNGRFALPGCDPEKPSEVFIYSQQARLGATAKLAGKLDQPVTIRLLPCGMAKARFVDEQGKPVVKLWPLLDILVTPGVISANNVKRQGLEAEIANMMNLDRDIYNILRSDHQGCAVFPSLVPGATYLLLAQGLGRGMIDLKKEFKVEPGQTLDLGDVLWPAKP